MKPTQTIQLPDKALITSNCSHPQINDQRKKKVDEVTWFVCAGHTSWLAIPGEGEKELCNLECNHFSFLSKSPMTHLTFETGNVQVPSAIQTIKPQLLVCDQAVKQSFE